MGYTVNIADPNDEKAQIEQEQDQNWISGLIGPDEDATEPFVALYYPVVEGANTGVSLVDDPAEDHAVVGTITMTIFWRELFKNILSSGSNGIIAVVDNDCHTPFTYQILGSDANLWGEGISTTENMMIRKRKLICMNSFRRMQSQKTEATLVFRFHQSIAHILFLSMLPTN